MFMLQDSTASGQFQGNGVPPQQAFAMPAHQPNAQSLTNSHQLALGFGGYPLAAPCADVASAAALRALGGQQFQPPALGRGRVAEPIAVNVDVAGRQGLTHHHARGNTVRMESPRTMSMHAGDAGVWLDDTIRAVQEHQKACNIGRSQIAELRRMIAAPAGIVPPLDLEGEQARAQPQRDDELHFRAQCQKKIVELEGALAIARAQETCSQQAQDALESRATELEEALEDAQRKLEERESGLLARIAEMEEQQSQREATLQTEVVELERQQDLKEGELLANIAKLEKQAEQQQQDWLARVAETEKQHEEETGDLRARLARQEKLREQKEGEMLVRIAELEEELDQTKRQKQQKEREQSKRIAELEGELHEVKHRRQFKERELQTKVAELEQELVNAGKIESSNELMRNTHRARISELELQLEDLQSAETGRAARLDSFRTRSAELEAKLLDCQKAEDRQNRLHRSRISELESQVEDGRSSEARQERRHRSHVEDLEVQLAGRVRTSSNMRALQLEQEVADMRAWEDSRASRHSSLQAEVAKLEQEVVGARVAEQRHMREQVRMTEMEHELEASRMSEERMSKQHTSHRRQSLQLEDELAQVHAQHGASAHRLAHIEGELVRAQQQAATNEQEAQAAMQAAQAQEQLHRSQRTSLQELHDALASVRTSEEQQHAAFAAFTVKVGRLEEEHYSARARHAEVEQELAQTRLDAREACARRASMESDSSEELRQALRRASELQAQLADAQKEPSQLRKRLSKLEAKLAGAEEDGRAHHTGELLQGSPTQQAASAASVRPKELPAIDKPDDQGMVPRIEASFPMAHLLAYDPRRVGDAAKGAAALDSVQVLQPFLRECWEACQGVDSALRSAMLVHCDSLAAQLAAAQRNSQKEVSAVELLHRPEAAASRRAAAFNMEEREKDVWRLQALAEAQTQLASQERADLAQYLGLKRSICGSQAQLLHMPEESLLSELPEGWRRALVDARVRGMAQPSWDESGGLSPLQQAAQRGRFDLVEYFLACSGILQSADAPEDAAEAALARRRELLEVRDGAGRSALYHAQLALPGMVHWWRLEYGITSPLHAKTRRADFGLNSLGRQKQLIEQLEMHGWQAARWADGFSLLHWAAEEGHVALCRYLMDLSANPRELDGEGRSALECAKSAGHAQAVCVLLEWGQPAAQLPEDDPSSSSDGEAADDSPKAIPPAYLEVMRQIDEVGWDNMDWTHGYTLLHWAAKNNNAALVARFLAQGADATQRDATGRHAIDYAEEFGSAAALEQLEAGAASDLELEPVDALPVAGTDSRRSVFVDARLAEAAAAARSSVGSCSLERRRASDESFFSVGDALAPDKIVDKE